jgi:putative transposase
MAGMARSTFYYQRQARRCGDKYAKIKQVIRAVYDEHKGRYGYRRMTTELRNRGHGINHKAIQSLMGQLKLKSLVKPKKYQSYRGQVGTVAPNVLQRKFTATGPNQKWVTDVTEFKVAGEKLYLSPVLDLYNGEIISYSIAKRPRFEMVKSMLKKAFKRLKEHERPLLHSDQGWQYQMRVYQKMLADRKIIQSMSRKGNCLDNAVMENFFGILKSECFYLQKFSNVDDLAKELDQYIHYYNHKRIKQKLKGLSPVQYRTQSLLAA